MAHVADARIDTDRIDARITYAVNTGEKLVNEVGGPGVATRRVVGTYEDHDVVMRNGRALRDTFDIETHGFEFVDHPTKVKDFYDQEAMVPVYYPEAEKLILEVTGARRVHIFDHTLRNSDEAERNVRQVREPAAAAHNDYTEWSARKRLGEILPDEADELGKGRFAIVQAWRATNTPIEQMPLAMCDARTIADGDLIISERRSPGRIGQTYRVSYNPAHEWYWFPHMARDEALVFKVFDSKTDSSARFTAHSAFPNPVAPPNAPPRESIEIRSFVFW